MFIKPFYVVQDRGNKMFVKGLIKLTADINEADQYDNRFLAYEMAGDTYDVMVFHKVLPEKDKF